MDYESWLIEAGGRVLSRAAADPGRLSAWDRAVKALWVADYSLRNAGDLLAAYDVDAQFKADGLAAAANLGLPHTAQLFRWNDARFEQCYFDVFEDVCRELVRVPPAARTRSAD